MAERERAARDTAGDERTSALDRGAAAAPEPDDRGGDASARVASPGAGAPFARAPAAEPVEGTRWTLAGGARGDVERGGDDAEPLDLVVIGGGVNGSGVARDAVGRGLSVVLLEKGDIGEGTSSRSGKYIHGGLRYLEYYEFRLVREALIEREVVLGIAPHLAWPLRLVLPHSPEQRPRWLIRLGLFLYDHLGGRKKLPATQAIDLARAAEGEPIDDAFRHAFGYYDVWVDDARLTLLNALDAAERGATVLPRTRFESAEREDGLWRVTWRDVGSGEATTRRTRALVNAAGPWVEEVIGGVGGAASSKRVRLVKGSHLIMRRWWRGDHGYVLQHTDRRLIFVNPLFDDLALVGTTDIPYAGRSEDVAIDEAEIDYLLGIMNRYFTAALSRADIVDSYSGVRPLFDDDSDKSASAVTRDYTFELDTGRGGRAVSGSDARRRAAKAPVSVAVGDPFETAPGTARDGADAGGGRERPRAPSPVEDGATAADAPLLSAFGGKLTTYRKLAEHALEKLRPRFPSMGRTWTGGAPLPGGDMPGGDFDAWLAGFRERHPWLPDALARHYARCYGTRADTLLDGASTLDDLGRHFGGLLHEREARWLVEHEWARTAEDILWRRTKHRLFMSVEERDAFERWLATLNIVGRTAEPEAARDGAAPGA